MCISRNGNLKTSEKRFPPQACAILFLFCPLCLCLSLSRFSGVLGAALDSSVSGSPRRSCGTVGTSGKADYTRRAASWRDGVPVAVSTEYVSCIRVRNFPATVPQLQGVSTSCAECALGILRSRARRSETERERRVEQRVVACTWSPCQ